MNVVDWSAIEPVDRTAEVASTAVLETAFESLCKRHADYPTKPPRTGASSEKKRRAPYSTGIFSLTGCPAGEGPEGKDCSL